MAFRALNLAADRDPWQQQPGESAAAYRKFVAYREQPGRRSYAKVAESFGITRRTVEAQAKAHQWQTRVTAFDDNELAERRQAIRRQSAKLATAQIEVALGMTQTVARSVRYALDNGIALEPSDAARWLDIAAKVAKVATSQPDITVGVTGADGGPVEVSIPELDGLTPDQQRARLNDMIGSLARLDDYRDSEAA